MIEPDTREFLWYDVNSLLNANDGRSPNYFTTLFDKCRILFASEQKKHFCLTCKSFTTISKVGDNVFCTRELQVSEDGKNVERIDENEHQIAELTPNEAIQFMVGEIEDYLIEPSGFRMDIYDIEGNMFGWMNEGYFETKSHGDVTKSYVMKRLYMVKVMIVDILIGMRDDIRFSNPSLAEFNFNRLRTG